MSGSSAIGAVDTASVDRAGAAVASIVVGVPVLERNLKPVGDAVVAAALVLGPAPPEAVLTGAFAVTGVRAFTAGLA
jgi:hypothetical protein